MTKRKSATGPAAAPSTLSGLENAAGFDSVTMDEILEASRTCWSALTELNAEMARFASDRTQANLEACRELAQCENISEVPKLHQTWVQQAAEAYTLEMKRLAEIATATRQARTTNKK